MRFVHRVYSFTAIAVLACVGFTACTTPASAINVVSPTEGQLVRDKVKIVIPKSSLPPDVIRFGFVNIKIDGQFTAAVGTRVVVSDDKSSGNPNVVFIWDSKKLTDDGEQPMYRDGRHEITVSAHSLVGGSDGKEMVVESTSINVQLKNQVARPDPAPPVHMKYRYHSGQLSKYKVSVTGELLDSNGYSLTGSQPPIVGEFIVDQSMEDVNSDGSALVRYKVEKDAFTQIFGQISLLSQTTKFKSVYKIMDTLGRTIDANVLSSKSTEEITDCLIKLPSRSIQVGESWPTLYRMKLEGICPLADFSGTSTLAGLEWEGGFECAKIKSKLDGSPVFNFMPSGGAVKTNSTAYFAYKPGKLIKTVDVITFGTTMDAGTLSSIQQQVSSLSSPPESSAGSQPGSLGGAPSYAPSGYSSGRIPRGGYAGSYKPSGPISSGGYARSSSPSMGSMGSVGTMGSGNTAVTIRITVTRELVK